MPGGYYTNSATPSSNTSVNSIAIQGTSNAGNFDDAVRELCAQGRQFANDIGGNNTVGGTADAITITPSAGAIATVYNGLTIGFQATADNTGTVTANVGSLGIEPVKKAVLGAETALAAGDIKNGGFYWLRWRSAWDSAGGAWQLLDANGASQALATTSSPQFTAIELGAATDTTLSRSAAGILAVEGNIVPSPASQAEGDILYRGASSWARLAKGTASQILRMNSGATAPEWGTAITRGTAQATTSGTVFDFGSIPSWVRRITILFAEVSLSGTDDLLVQIGDSGGVETTSYESHSGNFVDENTSTAGFIIDVGVAAGSTSGTMTLVNISGNIWVSSHAAAVYNDHSSSGGGQKTLSDVLDRVRITRTGTDTFDAGSVNILYE